MITKIVDATIDQFVGLSTDTKPTENVDNNSLFLELDTNKFYYFANRGWAEVGTEAPTLPFEFSITIAPEDWTVDNGAIVYILNESIGLTGGNFYAISIGDDTVTLLAGNSSQGIYLAEGNEAFVILDNGTTTTFGFNSVAEAPDFDITITIANGNEEDAEGEDS